jgi:hypothetical protein
MNPIKYSYSPISQSTEIFQVSVVELGLTETAQYAGSTLGSKARSFAESAISHGTWIKP